jgi:thiamine-monophosphate kinase
MRENDFLQWIRQQTSFDPARVPVGIGDDMAAVHLQGSSPTALLKIDQCLDRVHFDLRHHSATGAGAKAVNRCLSDCAGMACLPTAIMISVALPKTGEGSGEAFAQELFLACRDAAAKFNCPLVGGDTGTWDGRLAITVAALGEQPAGTPPLHPVLRSGAKPGDTLFVSGKLGGSILGRHLSFEPRIALAQQLAKALGTGPTGGLHAMMDLSDGLAQDLPRLCAASGVGAEVHAARLPVHPDAHTLAARDNLPAGLHALADGEDYELLFAVDADRIPDLIPLSERGPVPLTAIGTVTAGNTLTLLDDRERPHPWPRLGWEHRSAP